MKAILSVITSCMLLSCSMAITLNDPIFAESAYVESDVETKVESIERDLNVFHREHMTIEVEEPEIEDEYKLCDIPLDEELQKWVIDYCYSKNLSPYLVFAICERESNFTIDIVGDRGRSIGIMQIQPKWHRWRMEELGVTDLKDFKSNIQVGVHILLDLFEQDSNVEWVLMAYNGGPAYANKLCKKGVVSDYAAEIIERAYELEVA